MNYQERDQHFRQIADQLKKKYNLLSFGRLLFFFFTLGMALFLAQQNGHYALIWILLASATFLFMVLRHRKVQEEEQQQRRLAEVNRLEQAAQEYRLTEFPDGHRYQDALHPYAADLDLFGPHSVFQFCNRTVTAVGSTQLADWLKEAAGLEQIRLRQEAVQELAHQLEWRQYFRAYGLAEEDDPLYQESLQGWMAEPFFVYSKKTLYWVLWVLPLLTILAIGIIVSKYPLTMVLLAILPSAILLQRNYKQVNRTLEYTAKAETWLARYAVLIQQIELLDGSKGLLQELRQCFRDERVDFAASRAIRRLSYCLSQLNVRHNPFAIFLNLIGLWDLQWVYQLEKWKALHREDLPRWFVALGQMDALCSLANVHYNHPDWAFPELHEVPTLDAIQLGHPLIPDSRRVGNDLHMPTREHLMLLTGSNMAGKSTWLRTLGVNLVLAQAGAPVCAQALRMPPLLVFTGMRTQDDLSASTSSFYAELRRLRALLDAVIARQGQVQGVFFLLDEILKGTNSRDRHQGSRDLILQLLHYQGAGFIATHDLELTAMEAEYPSRIFNVRMEVDIRKDELYFDYLLKPGVSQSFNASLLMRKMGIGTEKFSDQP
jgi:FtsH-binding integral membrane protein